MPERIEIIIVGKDKLSKPIKKGEASLKRLEKQAKRTKKGILGIGYLGGGKSS